MRVALGACRPQLEFALRLAFKEGAECGRIGRAEVQNSEKVRFRPVADIGPRWENLRMFGLTSALIALSAASLLASGPTEGPERVTSKEAVQRAEKCGLGPAIIRYEGDLQSDVLSVPSDAEATESQLRCLDAATGFGIFVELPVSLQPRFDALREARASAIMKAQAHDWLSKRGLLERVPQYVPGTTDEAAFTGQVERLCGPEAKGAFQSQYGLHALSPEWIMKRGFPPREQDEDAMACLMNATTIAGFNVSLIGNEAYRQ